MNTLNLPINQADIKQIAVFGKEEIGEPTAGLLNTTHNINLIDINQDIYITEFDTDIAWYYILSNKTLSDIPATPFSISIQDAETYGQKITQLAFEKGAVESTLNPGKTSYPVIGYIIFTLRFSIPPKINVLNNISRQDFKNLLKSNNDFDVSSYIPNWSSDMKPRYILHKNAYSKLNLIHIKLINTTSINGHTAFCLFNSLVPQKLNLECIQLIKELLSNNYGKSFNLVGSALVDPYYNDYIKYKKMYLQKKLIK